MQQQITPVDFQRQVSAYKVRYCRDRILRWIQSQGGVLDVQEGATQKLRALLDRVFEALPDLLPELAGRGLVDCHVYERDLQKKADLVQSDGTTWVDVTKHTGTLYSVWVASDVLEMETDDYQVLVLLHEFSHVLHGGEHSRNFHAFLDGLLWQFNQATGSRIENDYDGLRT